MQGCRGEEGMRDDGTPDDHESENRDHTLLDALLAGSVSAAVLASSKQYDSSPMGHRK